MNYNFNYKKFHLYYLFQYVKVQGTTKAVIIITSIDPAFYQRTLNLIIQKNNFDQCTIVCAVHHSILQYTSIFPDKNENSYEKLKENILNWMASETNNSQVCLKIMFIN